MIASKNKAGCMLVGGLILAGICWRVAAYANGKVGSPSDDLYYSVIGWTGTIGAIAGIGMFFWGAKLFAANSKR